MSAAGRLLQQSGASPGALTSPPVLASLSCTAAPVLVVPAAQRSSTLTTQAQLQAARTAQSSGAARTGKQAVC